MSDQTLNIDPSKNVNITGITVGRSFEFVFKQWLDFNKTSPKNFEGVFSMIITPCYGSKITYTEGNGLIKSLNTLTVKRKDVENSLKEGLHTYKIIKFVDSETSFIQFKGTLQVNK